MKQYAVILFSTLLLYACNTGNPYDGPATVATGSIDTRQKEEGKALFQQNCASCHNLLKEATGPPLRKELINQRSNEWMYTMLTDRKHLKKDKAYREMVKKYGGMTCSQFDLSKDQLASLLHYLKNPVTGY